MERCACSEVTIIRELIMVLHARQHEPSLWHSFAKFEMDESDRLLMSIEGLCDKYIMNAADSIIDGRKPGDSSANMKIRGFISYGAERYGPWEIEYQYGYDILTDRAQFSLLVHHRPDPNIFKPPFYHWLGAEAPEHVQ